ncbi:hypothetical protein L484_015556 [Morus notabilis]|uniref:Uncharacterized protein n=1 Tax=Morus notabilis TaxID=981085 RepID=W9SAY0_9ROSA|nr:hypothetical protein L484_015556 [Morus notabilis]
MALGLGAGVPWVKCKQTDAPYDIEHNNVKLCCKQIVEEAIKRGATDNLTVVMVSFHSEPPQLVVVERPRVRRSISAEGLHNLKCILEG